MDGQSWPVSKKTAVLFTQWPDEMSPAGNLDRFCPRSRIRRPRCPADGSAGSRRQGLGTAHRPCGRPRLPPIQVNGSASAGPLLLQRPFHAILQPLPWPDGIVASPPASWRGSANGSRLPDAAEVWARTSQGGYSGPERWGHPDRDHFRAASV